MRINGYPVLFILIGAIGLAMAAPSLFAGIEGDWRSARMFLFSGLFTSFAAAICGLAAGGARRESPRGELLTLVGVFAITPVFAAAPILLLAPALGPLGAYFEAVSCFTTTGATLIPTPEDAPRALHLWRATLGWVGGFTILVAAAAILTPRNLSGPQYAEPASPNTRRVGRILALDPGAVRIEREMRVIAPVYIALTATLTVVLVLSGQASFVALSHAMGTLSTSGITPISGGVAAGGGRVGEAFIAVCMILAAHRLLFTDRRLRAAPRLALQDPEIHLMAICVGVASAWLFLRHWLGAFTVAAEAETINALAALWGSVFTTISFLTTTGYASGDWVSARDWSGLDSPALILIGLAALGGGVASTAGGIKLYRAYALFSHSANELKRLAHPSMVTPQRISRGGVGWQGVMNAWVYLMLFIFALAAAVMLMTVSGLRFERALLAAISALSNTGPALIVVVDDPAAYAVMPSFAKMVLCVAMVLGRIEILVLVSLFNPGYWRK
jgi:trk system potassium uptake protein TrkH